SSEELPAGVKADPGNQLYWRQNRRRLDFESLRDTLLSVSGSLDLTSGGHADDITTEPFSHRRTVYGFVERQNLPGLFRTFDFASPDATSPQRFSTTVPQQALFLMNSPFVLERARALMDRPEIRAAESEEQKVRKLYGLLYQRKPDSEDLKLAHEFLTQPTSAPATEPPPWQYGYGSVDEAGSKVTGFQALPFFNNYSWQGGKELPDPKTGWALLNSEGGHPGAGTGFAVIRRWVAPRDGVISLRGELEHPSERGDGIRSRVISSREGRLGEWVAAHSRTNTPIDRIRLKAGDVLDLVTDCRGNEGYDTFQWRVTLKYTKADGGADAAGRTTWQTKEDFGGPTAPKAKPLGGWEKYAQALLLSNELVFVD
ncbi:MAG TPA: hypothetical protein DCM86_09265, partial [Verrucomicrobiales bacterium]|nr:hypothetical protein [Verrucomicrobiales bacterium]